MVLLAPLRKCIIKFSPVVPLYMKHDKDVQAPLNGLFEWVNSAGIGDPHVWAVIK